MEDNYIIAPVVEGQVYEPVVKVGDTQPIGAIIGFDTTQTIPNGWEYYAENQIKKIAPVTPANGNIKNSYGTSQTDTYSQEYINGKVESGNWTLISNDIYYKKVGNVVTLIRQARNDSGSFIQNEITLTGYAYTNIATTLPEEIRPSKIIAYNIFAHTKDNAFYTQAYGEIQTDGNLSIYNWGAEIILNRLAFCVTYILD